MAKRDPLARKLYAWENGFRIQIGKAPWTALRDIHELACGVYGVPPIPVDKAGPKEDSSFYRAGTKKPKICLIAKHRLLDVILHETAHYISDYYLGHDRPHHDEPFIRVYLWLLVHFKVFKRPFLAASLAAYGLELKTLSPSQIKKSRRKAG